MNIIIIDKDFIPAMKLQLVEGSLDQILNSTDRQYVINEAAAKRIGWESAVNKYLSPFGESRKKPVSGVVRDFNYRTLHNVIDPLVLVLYPNDRTLSTLSVRLEPGSLQESIAEVEGIYDNVTEGLPFEYSFLDENIETLYQAETRVHRLVIFLTAVALTFALLGIYSLISFSIENRTKEVAIRKILGITPRELVLLFSRSYLSLALLASLITLPLCYKLLGGWLDQFAYRTNLDPAWFGISILILVGSVITIGVVKYAALRQINPANALKYE
jgi:putative ABC transport system permease protein